MLALVSKVKRAIYYSITNVGLTLQISPSPTVPPHFRIWKNPEHEPIWFVAIIEKPQTVTMDCVGARECWWQADDVFFRANLLSVDALRWAHVDALRGSTLHRAALEDFLLLPPTPAPQLQQIWYESLTARRCMCVRRCGMGMDKEELVRNLNGYAAWPCAQAGRLKHMQ